MKISLILFTFFYFSFSYSQEIEIVTDSKGNRIKLYPNYHWEYADEDSLKVIACPELADEEYSSHAGTSIRSTQTIKILDKDEVGYLPLIKRQGNDIDGYNLSISFPGFKVHKCVEKNTLIYIKFYDHTEIIVNNYGNHNCRGDFNITFENNIESQKNLDLLLNKKIDSILVGKGEGSINIVLNSNQSNLLKRSIQCVYHY